MSGVPVDAGRRRALALGGATLAGLVAPALAQEPYPSRTVTMILGSGPGSGADLLCRLIAQGLGAALRQPFIADNRVGANGAIAGQAVVRAKNDGHTLLFGSASGTVINQATQPKAPFDTLTDLVPIAQIGTGGVPVVVSPRIPATDMAGFIAHIKANPGKYPYASWGIGSSAHLIMEWLKATYKLDLGHVPYKSVPAINQDLQGGVIDIALIDSGSALPLHKAGRIKVLGLTGTRLPPGFTDVQLMSQQGIAFSTDGWYGLFAPRDTPEPIVALLNREVLKLLAAPDFQAKARLLNLGDSPVKTPEQFARTVRDDLATWQQIVKSNNIRLE